MAKYILGDAVCLTYVGTFSNRNRLSTFPALLIFAINYSLQTSQSAHPKPHRSFCRFAEL
jgi:hypothetical protein